VTKDKGRLKQNPYIIRIKSYIIYILGHNGANHLRRSVAEALERKRQGFGGQRA